MVDYSSIGSYSLPSIPEMSIPNITGGMSPLVAGQPSNVPLPNNQAGFGFNIPTISLGLGALNSFAGIYGALQANSLAKKQFNMQRSVANANLANQIQSYNTALEDRSRSRAVMEGQSDAEAQAYVDKNRLAARTV